MKTTYIKLYAGLGNQIFQYFYGLYLQRNGKKVYYILNKTYGKNGECFDIPEVFNLYDLNEKPAENIFAPEKYFTNLRIAAAKIFAKYIMQSYQTGFYQKADYIEKAIDSKLTSEQDARFFLCSDDQDVKKYLKNKYGGIIMSYDSVLSRASKQGIKDAVIELWALSNTKEIWGSFYSSYSEIASAINGADLKIMKSNK